MDAALELDFIPKLIHERRWSNGNKTPPVPVVKDNTRIVQLRRRRSGDLRTFQRTRKNFIERAVPPRLNDMNGTICGPFSHNMQGRNAAGRTRRRTRRYRDGR